MVVIKTKYSFIQLLLELWTSETHSFILRDAICSFEKLKHVLILPKSARGHGYQRDLSRMEELVVKPPTVIDS